MRTNGRQTPLCRMNAVASQAIPAGNSIGRVTVGPESVGVKNYYSRPFADGTPLIVDRVCPKCSEVQIVMFESAEPK